MRLPNADYRLIAEMHTYRRPYGSKTEEAFIEKFIAPLEMEKDTFGNLTKVVGDAPPTVLWSSHTDSVHGGAGMQNVAYDAERHEIFLPNNTKSSCLGADCAAGVWIMTEMIKAGVPGLYVFHREEEVGHRGASFIAKTPERLAGIRAAIAFDRKGKTSVITHMGGERTCSDAFAKSLSAQLLEGYAPDNTGVWTDTVAYKGIVPECTNISVGYEGAHSASEMQSLSHLVALRDAMVKIDASQFVIERDPKKAEFKPMGRYPGWGSSRRQGDFRFDEPLTLRELIRDNSFAVADILESYGVTLESLQAAIKLRRIGYTTMMGDLAADAENAVGAMADDIDLTGTEVDVPEAKNLAELYGDEIEDEIHPETAARLAS
jgi:hypothetical protein